MRSNSRSPLRDHDSMVNSSRAPSVGGAELDLAGLHVPAQGGEAEGRRVPLDDPDGGVPRAGHPHGHLVAGVARRPGAPARTPTPRWARPRSGPAAAGRRPAAGVRSAAAHPDAVGAPVGAAVAGAAAQQGALVAGQRPVGVRAVGPALAVEQLVLHPRPVPQVAQGRQRHARGPPHDAPGRGQQLPEPRGPLLARRGGALDGGGRRRVVCGDHDQRLPGAGADDAPGRSPGRRPRRQAAGA